MLNSKAQEVQITSSKLNTSSNTFENTTEMLNPDENTGIWQLVQKFGFSFYSPVPFEVPNVKDTIVTIWNDAAGEKTYVKNWTNSIMYDSLSRVVRYSYSSCMNCGQIPYTEEIIYNDAGQISKINTYINDVIKQTNFERTMPIRHLDIFYDADNSINKMMVYESSILVHILEMTRK